MKNFYLVIKIMVIFYKELRHNIKYLSSVRGEYRVLAAYHRSLIMLRTDYEKSLESVLSEQENKAGSM